MIKWEVQVIISDKDREELNKIQERNICNGLSFAEKHGEVKPMRASKSILVLAKM